MLKPNVGDVVAFFFAVSTVGWHLGVHVLLAIGSGRSGACGVCHCAWFNGNYLLAPLRCRLFGCSLDCFHVVIVSLQALRAETMVERFTARMHVLASRSVAWRKIRIADKL